MLLSFQWRPTGRPRCLIFYGKRGFHFRYLGCKKIKDNICQWFDLVESVHVYSIWIYCWFFKLYLIVLYPHVAVSHICPKPFSACTTGLMVTSIDQIQLRLKKCPAVFFLQTQEHTLVGRSDPSKTVYYNLVVFRRKPVRTCTNRRGFTSVAA